MGTLENDGVGIADFHEFDVEVPQELKDKIEELKAGDHRRLGVGGPDGLPRVAIRTTVRGAAPARLSPAR